MTDLGSFERHDLPDGAAVFYRDSDHGYYRACAQEKGRWVGKGRLTGISTVVKPFDWRPDNLMRWAARMNGEGIALLAADALQCEDLESMRTQLAWLKSADSIWGALCAGRLTYEDLRDKAAIRGTNVHKHALHALATGAPVPRLGELTDEEKGYARGVMAFWHEHEPEPTHAEQVVADLELGVAGRFDVRALIAGYGMVLLDAKTGGYRSVTEHVQLAGYAACAERCGIGGTDAQLVLQVDAGGGYELIPVRATTEDFEAAVRVYRQAAEIGKQARADQKARATQREAAAA